MKKIVCYMFCVVIVLAFVSCGQKEEAVVKVDVDTISTTETPKPTPKPTATPEPTPDLTNKAINPLTGLYINKDTINRRPIAVVINNLQKALPQSGISQADIFYEVLAEGDITRIIAVFQDFDSKKIGPVRSARHYFLDFALDHDAIFVHHGGSQLAYSSLRSLKINNLDGMREGAVFWRDPVRFKQPGMYEHSSYTDELSIIEGIENKGYRIEKTEDYKPMFEFYDKVTDLENGLPAAKVTIPFSNNFQSVFEFDKTTNLYKKFQKEAKHIDEETNEQIAVANIIIQKTSMYVIAGDDAGRREVKLISKGDGILISNGKYVPITWKKDSHDKPTEWFDEKGEPLRLNKGRTWICIFDTDGKIVFE